MTQPTPLPYRRKLIEVAIPLDAINLQSARSIRKGSPHTLHYWWAHRPLAACRGIIFASLVDDPSSLPKLFPTVEEQNRERFRLFDIIRELVIWENSNNPSILKKASLEIAKSISIGNDLPLPNYEDDIFSFICENGPTVVDPFCGGGSIPLEAFRLGLPSHGYDLNPIPVLITKSIIEFASRFLNKPPVNPKSQEIRRISEQYESYTGLIEDLQYYGEIIGDVLNKKIGNFYPKITIDKKIIDERPELSDLLNRELTVMSWVWARTVESPNPALNNAHVPLIRSFWLSVKKNNLAWIEPIIDKYNNISFKVRTGNPPNDYDPKIGTVYKKRVRCLISGSPIPFEYIKNKGINNKLGIRLIAIVVEGPNGKIFLSPTKEHEKIIHNIKVEKYPDTKIPEKALGYRVQAYGMDKHYKIYSIRQLNALVTLSDSIKEIKDIILCDIKSSNQFSDNILGLFNGGDGKIAYAEFLTLLLTFPLGRAADYWSSIATWHIKNQQIRNTFSKQTVQMTWDYVEANPVGNSSGSWKSLFKTTLDSISGFPIINNKGFCSQHDASLPIPKITNIVCSTDPPYYANIGYSDLSDIFYIWFRRTIGDLFPDLFRTVLTPKSEELIADTNRHAGNKNIAKEFFESGFQKVFSNIRAIQHQDYPISIFYAFKQTESSEDESEDQSTEYEVSTGWETVLNGIYRSGLCIVGTWPIRSEPHHRMRAHESNALASSVVLVCRPRPDDATTVTRREFLSALKKELPQALHNLQQGLIAPVDLAQAAIGPGMAVFTRYAKVMESDGSAMTVRTALGIINQILDEVLAEQEGEFDTDTRWAVAWFEQHGMEEGPYGEAETLAVAKNISVQGIVDAGILTARGGKAKLIPRTDYPDDWDPATDTRLPVWEATQHLIRTLENQGESGAADLLNKLGGTVGDQTRDLAYRLYAICERKKWSAEAMAYNGLIISWPEISKLAQGALPGTTGQQQIS